MEGLYYLNGYWHFRGKYFRRFEECLDYYIDFVLVREGETK